MRNLSPRKFWIVAIVCVLVTSVRAAMAIES